MERGNEGIHAKAGQGCWDSVAAAMSARFKDRDFTGGLVHGITEAGRQLADHFPNQGPRDQNKLRDDADSGDTQPGE